MADESQCVGERARLIHDARLTKRSRNAGSAGYRQLALRQLTTGRPGRFQNSGPFAQLNALLGGRRATDSPWRHDCWRGSQRPGLRSCKRKREAKRSWNCCSSPKRKRVESSRHLHPARAKASFARWYATTRKSRFANFVRLTACFVQGRADRTESSRALVTKCRKSPFRPLLDFFVLPALSSASTI